jgi:hypothetical protein
VTSIVGARSVEVTGQHGVEDLEGDVPPKAHLVSAIHGRETAAAKNVDDLEPPD